MGRLGRLVERSEVPRLGLVEIGRPDRLELLLIRIEPVFPESGDQIEQFLVGLPRQDEVALAKRGIRSLEQRVDLCRRPGCMRRFIVVPVLVLSPLLPIVSPSLVSARSTLLAQGLDVAKQPLRFRRPPRPSLPAGLAGLVRHLEDGQKGPSLRRRQRLGMRHQDRTEFCRFQGGQSRLNRFEEICRREPLLLIY